MWTRETRAPFSTEAALPSTWPLERYAPQLVASLHGCQEKAAAAVIAAHAKHHTDDAWIDAALGRLSAPALAVLEVLAAHGGFLHLHELTEILEDTYAFGPDAIRVAVDECLPPLLVVPLATPRGSAAALVASAADRVAHRVAGLRERAAPERPLRAIPGDDGRALLAIAAWLGQLDLKLTQSSEPHRAGVKRIAKQLGVTEQIVESRVRTAWRLGLVDETEDAVLRPDTAALAGAATGRFSRHHETDAVVARLRELDRPLSLAAIDRWSTACLMRGGQHVIAEDLAHLPGIVLEVDEPVETKPAKKPAGGVRRAVAGVTVDDMRDEGRYVRAQPIPDEVAITITPSFEVFIAPEARLSQLVAVVPLCEPVRLDRVIVGRLTKLSIQRAAASGRTAEEMLAYLAAASKIPVPGNVAAAIRDWTASSAVAVTTTGRVIVVPPEVQDRLVAILPPSAAARVLAPGVVVCSLELTERAVNLAFEKLSLVARRDAEPIVPRPVRKAVPLPGLVTASARLRARLARYLAGDPEERARLERAIARARSQQQPAVAAGRVAPDAPPPSRRYGFDADFGDQDDDLEREWETAWEEAPPALHRLVSRFEQRLDIELTIREYGALLFALTQISQPERSFVLEERDLERAVARLATVVASAIARRGDVGDRLLRALEALGVPLASLAAAKAPPTPSLEWHRTDLVARIVAAERVHARVILDVGDRQQRVHLRKLVPRGNTMMILGDAPDGVGVAFPIEAIRGIADDPAAAAADSASSSSASSGRWAPTAGMAPPGGHTPCPCGSGKRYRQCCRDAP